MTSSGTWESRMLELEKFMITSTDIPHHNARLATHLVDKETERLAYFLKRQRKERETLTQSQQARLEAISGFTWDPLGTAWATHVADWLAAHSLAQAANPSGSAAPPLDPDLARWILVQRRLYQEAMRSELPLTVRMEELESLPGWTWTPSDRKRASHSEQLRTFVEANGRPPRNHKAAKRNAPFTESEQTEHFLSTWLSRTRAAAKRGAIEPNELAALDQILNVTTYRDIDQCRRYCTARCQQHAPLVSHDCTPSAAADALVEGARPLVAVRRRVSSCGHTDAKHLPSPNTNELTND